MSEQFQTLSQSTVEQVLDQHIDPHLEVGLKEAGVIKAVRVTSATAAEIDLVMPYPCARYQSELEVALKALLAEAFGSIDATFSISHRVIAHSVQTNVTRMDNIRNVIAVASGKGGVGKSTTSVNLALALSAEGASVGILDADIYGPSQPRMLGLSGQPDSVDGKSLEPMENYGVQSMSIGYLIDEGTPMIWRGPMVTGALEQLLNDTRWRDLDYLIIDLPPGTGDIQLTLTQKVPVSGALIVTTPQDIALLDARKGLKMFEKVKVPVLGIIENMSVHICSQCGHEEPIFGSGGGASMATDAEVPLLGQLPLEMDIRLQADNGKPTVVSDPDSRTSAIYREIARKTAARLSRQAKDYSAKFPKIVIQNT